VCADDTPDTEPSARRSRAPSSCGLTVMIDRQCERSSDLELRLRQPSAVPGKSLDHWTPISGQCQSARDSRHAEGDVSASSRYLDLSLTHRSSRSTGEDAPCLRADAVIWRVAATTAAVRVGALILRRVDATFPCRRLFSDPSGAVQKSQRDTRRDCAQCSAWRSTSADLVQ